MGNVTDEWQKIFLKCLYETYAMHVATSTFDCTQGSRVRTVRLCACVLTAVRRSWHYGPLPGIREGSGDIWRILNNLYVRQIASDTHRLHNDYSMKGLPLLTRDIQIKNSQLWRETLKNFLSISLEWKTTIFDRLPTSYFSSSALPKQQ